VQHTCTLVTPEQALTVWLSLSQLLLFGQVQRIWPAKYVLLIAVILFEIGSAVCGSAHSINFLIFGRAFSGMGAAGVMTSSELQ